MVKHSCIEIIMNAMKWLIKSWRAAEEREAACTVSIPVFLTTIENIIHLYPQKQAKHSEPSNYTQIIQSKFMI